MHNSHMHHYIRRQETVSWMFLMYILTTEHITGMIPCCIQIVYELCWKVLMCFEKAYQFKLKMWISIASKCCSHLTSRRKWKLPKYTIEEVHLHKEKNKIWLDAKKKLLTLLSLIPAPLTVKLFQKLNIK